MRNIDINNNNKESWWSSHISWTPAVLFDASLHLHMRVCPCARFSVSIKWKGQKMPISAQLDIVAMHWFITECVYVFPHRENISMHWTHERQPFFWKIFVSLDEITEWVKLVTEYSTAEFLSKFVIVSQRGKSRSPTLSCRHAYRCFWERELSLIDYQNHGMVSTWSPLGCNKEKIEKQCDE